MLFPTKRVYLPIVERQLVITNNLNSLVLTMILIQKNYHIELADVSKTILPLKMAMLKLTDPQGNMQCYVLENVLYISTFSAKATIKKRTSVKFGCNYSEFVYPNVIKLNIKEMAIVLSKFKNFQNCYR